MKRFYSISFFMLLIFIYSNSFSQKLYDDINPLAYTQGKRLTIGSTTNPLYPGELLTAEYQDSANSLFGANLYVDYRQWKFTDKLMLAAYGKVGITYAKSKTSDFMLIQTNENKDISASVYGAASYYLTPNKFYVTGALGLAFNNQKTVSTTSVPNPFPGNGDIDSTVAPSFLWGALGYGRINNRQVVEVSYDFSDELKSRGIIESELDDKTLRKISELLYRQADGEYLDKYEDDEYVKLFKDIEATLLTAGYISEKLGAEAAVKLYEILRNNSKKYVFYPKYSGYQTQAQVQYQITNESKDRTHQHFLSLSGAYCLNVTNKTNMVFSGYFAIPLDTLAKLEPPRAGFSADFQNFLAFIPDRNNLDFFKVYPGTGDYSKQYTAGLLTVYGVRADIFHSFSSVSGFQGTLSVGNFKTKYADAIMVYKIAGRYDYNIYSSLTAFFKAELTKDTDVLLVAPAKFSSSVGISYRIF